ncbi:hypothetical protein PHAVU_008G076200 [Phaseolus vulgaris]|uniref:Uncharacterized protein n=1 Tax=Phaseolus vulgaris TaxID=3885 RepID=V7B346_PHAVU|nr:hypothetical protein PHAVU_008G076200g [Phaseolus vulgaris]XP_007140003.1 hypothetical protein PHAVU_008G076200g [Phaseolus vulgaris]ESW11995.1 hypothetical protein PHAVU_008G076200g [Phaseolus vulgaris]ESW11997.1 hypothetical protein PHAVU_008G076200g [Phaseolus vulgaris]
MTEVLYWISTFVLILTLLCILGYQVVVPEFIIQGSFCFINLIAGHWFIFLLSLPFLYYNVRTYIRREHLADVTEIYNKLNWEKKKRLFKVAYLVAVFVMSVVSLVWTLTEDVH